MEVKDYNPSYMKLAIESALQGILQGAGGPFGACIVKNNRIISVAHNTVIQDADPTCHAEMNAIRKAVKFLKTHELKGCEIYSTAEPCPMCLGAIYWARLEKIYVGVDKALVARYGFDDSVFYEQFQKETMHRSIPYYCGIAVEEIEDVFIKWKKMAGIHY